MTTISEADLQQQLHAWLGAQSRDAETLQRALNAVYRDRPHAQSFEEVLRRLLLTVAHTHEAQVGATIGRLEEILNRLLDDIQEARGVRGEGRPAAQRQADLQALSGALNELSTFQDHVRSMVGKDPAQLRAMMRGILAGREAGPPTSAAQTATVAAEAASVALNRSRSRGDAVLSEGRQVEKAWRQGYSSERPGDHPRPLSWPQHPALVEAMTEMIQAMNDYQAAWHATPEAAAQAVDDLQEAVAKGRDRLRGMARRFEEHSTLDPIPPTHPIPAGHTPAPGTPAANALEVRRRLAHPAITDQAPAAQLFDALEFGPLEVTAEGKLGEPLERSGLEAYALSPSQIAALPTDPPWLAARLAELVDGWQRAHLVGAGFGGETFAGLMMSSNGVNQIAQNRGIEKFLRAAAEHSHEVDVMINARGRRLAIPLADGSFEYIDVLGSLHYNVATPAAPGFLDFTIAMDPDGAWHVTHDLPSGTPGADVPLGGAQ